MRDMEEIGAHLRSLRNAAGLTLSAAADLIGMPAVVIGSYERADRRPGVDQLARVYAAYGYELTAIPIGATVVEGSVPAATVLTDEQIATALRSLADHVCPPVVPDPGSLATLRGQLVEQRTESALL